MKVTKTSGALMAVALTWAGLSAFVSPVTANATTLDPPVQAASSESSTSAQFAWTADPSTAGVRSARAAALTASEPTMSAAASVLPAPATWAGCGVATDPQKIVRTFPRSKVLRCGNANYGYWHIYEKHRSQFEQLAAQTYQNWRDVADIGMYASINDSTVTRLRNSNDTTCLSKRIYLINLRTGKTATSTIIRTVTGNRSNNVITTFPSSGYCTGTE